jgi:hypothetical protein
MYDGKTKWKTLETTTLYCRKRIIKDSRLECDTVFTSTDILFVKGEIISTDLSLLLSILLKHIGHIRDTGNNF